MGFFGRGGGDGVAKRGKEVVVGGERLIDLPPEERKGRETNGKGPRDDASARLSTRNHNCDAPGRRVHGTSNLTSCALAYTSVLL